MLPWAHPITNPKQHRNRFSRFFTAHSRVDILYNGPPVFSLKLPIPIHGSLGPLESSTETASWSVQPSFCGTHGRASLYFTMGCSFPLKIAPSDGVYGLPSNNDSLGPYEPITQTTFRLVQLFLHSLSQGVPILYNTNGQPLLLSKLPVIMGHLDPHLIHGSTKVLNRNHLDRFSRFSRTH